MKYLGLALLLPLSANAQTASVFHFLVPNGAATASIGFRGAALGYEDKVPGGKILVLQYALLHGLTDWSGHAQDRDADLALLKEAGITVTPLAPEQRVILEDKLQSVRTKRNFGVPNAGNNRRPMSLQQMAEAHRALIAENAANIKYGAPGTGGDATRMTPAARERLLGELATELAALAAVPASDDAGWAKAVAAVNATAAQFGRKDAVIDAASPRAAASSAALAVYERERAAAAADATAEHRTLTLPQAAELRDKYGALFDGSAGPRPNLGLPTGPLNTGRREMSHNAQGPGSDLPVPGEEPRRRSRPVRDAGRSDRRTAQGPVPHGGPRRRRRGPRRAGRGEGAVLLTGAGPARARRESAYGARRRRARRFQNVAVTALNQTKKNTADSARSEATRAGSMLPPNRTRRSSSATTK